MALGAVAALALTACGGGDDDSDDTSASSRSTTTSSTAEPASSSPELDGLDYRAALLAPDDLGFLPASFTVADTGDTKGSFLRDVCGRDADEALTAAAGEFVELQDAAPSASVTTSVQAFATENQAKSALGVTEAQARVCDTIGTFVDSTGATFAPIDTPLIQDAGDEQLSLFTRKTDTGLLVADHFVRDGQFVFAIRFAADRTSPVTQQTAGAITDEAARKFTNWVDDQ
jgi:hypothetical protein